MKKKAIDNSVQKDSCDFRNTHTHYRQAYLRRYFKRSNIALCLLIRILPEQIQYAHVFLITSTQNICQLLRLYHSKQCVAIYHNFLSVEQQMVNGVRNVTLKKVQLNDTRKKLQTFQLQIGLMSECSKERASQML